MTVKEDAICLGCGAPMQPCCHLHNNVCCDCAADAWGEEKVMNDLLIAIPGEWAEGPDLEGPPDMPVWNLYKVMPTDNEPAYEQIAGPVTFGEAWHRAERLRARHEGQYSWPPIGH